MNEYGLFQRINKDKSLGQPKEHLVWRIFVLLTISSRPLNGYLTESTNGRLKTREDHILILYTRWRQGFFVHLLTVVLMVLQLI
jgi:hypothetical protein